MVSPAVHAASSTSPIRLVLGLLLFYNVDDFVGNSQIFYLPTR